MVIEPVERRLPRVLLVPGATAMFVSLACYYLVIRQIGQLRLDVEVYRRAGQAFLNGQPIYETGFIEGWPYTYPPVTLPVSALLAPFSRGQAAELLNAVNIAAIVLAVWLAFGILGYRRDAGRLGATLALSAGLIWTEPIWSHFDYGQINLLLLVLVLADLNLRDGNRAKGVLIGLAAAYKLMPALFVLYLLLTRRIRAAVVGMVSFAVATALGFAVAPADSAHYWFTGAFLDDSRILQQEGLDSIWNQSLTGQAARLFGESAGRPVGFAVGVLVAVAGLFVAVAAWRREEELLAAVVIGFVTLLITPVTWTATWVWLVPLTVLLAELGRRYARTHPVLACAAPAVSLLVFLAWPLRGPVEYSFAPRGWIWLAPDMSHSASWGLVHHLAGALYVGWAMAMLIAAALYVRRSADPRGSGIVTAGVC